MISKEQIEKVRELVRKVEDMRTAAHEVMEKLESGTIEEDTMEWAGCEFMVRIYVILNAITMTCYSVSIWSSAIIDNFEKNANEALVWIARTDKSEAKE